MRLEVLLVHRQVHEHERLEGEGTGSPRSAIRARLLDVQLKTRPVVLWVLHEVKLFPETPEKCQLMLLPVNYLGGI